MVPSTFSDVESPEAPTLDGIQGRERIRLLLEVSESIASHRDLNELFGDLALRLPRIVPFDYINLMLHDRARDVMRLHLLVAPVDSTIKPGAEFPVDDSPGGSVWQTQVPLIVNDIELEHRFPAVIPRLRANGVQSFCSVPLTTAFGRLGAMGFGSLRKHEYQPSELAFMQEVAKLVAVAVDNALHDYYFLYAEGVIRQSPGSRSAPWVECKTMPFTLKALHRIPV
jgi:formate hydrogenlyase transcriptional activator